MSQGRIRALCIRAGAGVEAHPVEEAHFVAGHGIEGDIHAGTGHRQVSLLAEEALAPLRCPGLPLLPGACGENVVTEGFPLEAFEVGRRLRIGDGAVLQLTQLGNSCLAPCPTSQEVGACIMQRIGVFARVRKGGQVRPGDPIVTDPELDQVRWAVLTLSDRGASGERMSDASGDVASELLEHALAGRCIARAILADEQEPIAAELRRLCDEEVCDLVVTTGGTGLSPRDVTPEATLAVVDRLVPGMAEAMRAAGLRHTPRAMLSRGICGLRGQALIVNLAGSPRAVREQLEAVLPALPHALQVATGIRQDCGREPRDAHEHHL